MVDSNTVCCMCGDVGFPEKLFRCSRCLRRLQHPYCSNYYEEDSSEAANICDWCRSKERSGASYAAKKQAAGKEAGNCLHGRSEYTGCERIKQEEGVERSRAKASGVGASGSSSSPRPGGRRYKLLKDVLC